MNLPDSWLWDDLGLAVRVRGSGGASVDEMIGLALRRNPRRAHLLVSRVLGKHLPVAPATALAAAHRLAGLVPTTGVPPLVLGYCETATSLGHAVADRLTGSDYIHTTRRTVPGRAPLLEFDEAHSHASTHWLVPSDPGIVARDRPLVLVDDELTTGRTALGTIRALHAHAPHSSYTVATLFDARPAAARVAFDDLARDLGVPVEVVSLLAGEVVVPRDVADRAARIRERFAAPGAARPQHPEPRHQVRHVSPRWPRTLPDGARHGWTTTDSALLDATVACVADEIAAGIAPGSRVLVLGTEELMYTPLRIGAALAAVVDGPVVFHSTTRSPVHPIDIGGYAIRTALTFPSPDDPSRVSHVYNVAPGMYEQIVVVLDDAVDGSGASHAPDPAGMLEALRGCAAVTLVTVPSAGRAAARGAGVSRAIGAS